MQYACLVASCLADVRMHVQGTSDSALQARRLAILSALGAALATHTNAVAIAELTVPSLGRATHHLDQSGGQSAVAASTVTALLLHACTHGSPAVQQEAVAALRSACAACPDAVLQHASSIAAAVDVLVAQAQPQRQAALPDPDSTATQHRNSHGSGGNRRSSLQSSGGGYGASIAEKTAAQALRLAGDLLHHMYTSSAALDARGQSSAWSNNAEGHNKNWQAAADLFAGKLLQHTSSNADAKPTVQSGALAALASLPSSFWSARPLLTQQSVQVATTMATSSAFPGVRSNALKVFEGALADHMCSCLQDLMPAAFQSMASASADSAMSVRTASIMASAACARALEMLTGGVTDPSDEHSSDAMASQPHASISSKSATGAGDEQSRQASTAALKQLHSKLSAAAWQALQQAILGASIGGDKLRVAGMRATACLAVVAARIISAMDGDASVQLSWEGWLRDTIPAVGDALNSSNAKCAWNAAIAARVLLQSTDAFSSCTSALASLPPALLRVVADSSNYKVRIQAVRALLACQAQRDVMPRPGLAQAAVTLCKAFCALLASSGEASRAPVATTAAPVMEPELPDASLNYRYQAALRQCLQSAVLLFIGLLAAGDLAAIDGKDGQALAAGIRACKDLCLSTDAEPSYEQVRTCFTRLLPALPQD